MPVPGVPFETVPLRPGREVLASLSPLYLALLLPLGALLLEINSSLPVANETPSIITLADYENFEPTLPKPDVLAEIAPEPPSPSIVAASEPVPAAADAAEPAPSAQPAAAVRTSLVLAAIEMDAFDPMPPALRASATRVRVASLARPRPAGLLASDFDLVEREARPPPLLPAPAASAIALPAVSAAGPDATSIPAASLSGVGALQAGDPLPMPPAPVVAQLPESSHSVAFARDLLAVGRREAAGPSQSQPLEGVPLESLAACETREREDGLKQELMLAVSSGSRCSGPGGTYNFLETKNLNAFLLRVAHDAGQELGNRCDELMRAQQCVTARHVAGVLP